MGKKKNDLFGFLIFVTIIAIVGCLYILNMDYVNAKISLEMAKLKNNNVSFNVNVNSLGFTALAIDRTQETSVLTGNDYYSINCTIEVTNLLEENQKLEAENFKIVCRYDDEDIICQEVVITDFNILGTLEDVDQIKLNVVTENIKVYNADYHKIYYCDTLIGLLKINK